VWFVARKKTKRAREQSSGEELRRVRQALFPFEKKLRESHTVKALARSPARREIEYALKILNEEFLISRARFRGHFSQGKKRFFCIYQ
jgi:hypothetical protein